MSITDARARNAKPSDKDYKVTGDRGLYLLVKTNGSKLWRYKYRFSGKERTLAMGAYPEVSLCHSNRANHRQPRSQSNRRTATKRNHSLSSHYYPC
ncbi:Arm DNA-binding domain-containing protein [Endozoicomonas sp. SESOKO1]|uniref:Arm DNA-binding domain-containing protein n=1 Tax=Endozoicomonas sp. SESOKO1 TaxID=2828742 RepID=UPI0021476353|nr:Arm DNA-binding domain-containing protein [Endozoicomonas sp. SESOKO1]